MKINRIFISILIFVSILLVGCGNRSEILPAQVDNENTRLNIVTTFYPLYIMAINITKDIPGVIVQNMAQPDTGCLHDYQLTPGNVKTIENADVLVINGAGLENFIEKIIVQKPELKIIDASEGITLLKENGKDSNPHIWVSISGAIEMVKNIGGQMAEIDSSYKTNYEFNVDSYIQKLEDLRIKMHAKLDGIENKKIVTFHEAFSYFAHEFNLNIIATISQEPNSEPSARELAETITIIKKSGISSLFAEPQYSKEIVDVIARETGTKVYYLNPATTGPMDANSYIDIMESNLLVLQEVLNNV